MRVLLNIIWLILAGVWLALGYVIAAALMAITIIGLPFAKQALKLVQYAIWPVGRTLIKSETRNIKLSVVATYCGSSWSDGGSRSNIFLSAAFYV
jgi:uncharacterized membrane protein YccF (DUF307 family)